MTKIYLTDTDNEAIVDFVKDHEELYEKHNGKFNEKARKNLWERFTPISKSVKELDLIPKNSMWQLNLV